MTNEEMERAIEFLLAGQATLEQRIEQTNTQLQQTDAQLQQTNQQLAELGRLLETHAETQSEFIEIATRSIEALTAAQSQTDARLNILIGVVERHVTQGHDRQG